MAKNSALHESLVLPDYQRITGFGKITENSTNVRTDLRIRAYLAP